MKGSYVFMAYDPFSSDLITRPRKSTLLELAITPRNFGYPIIIQVSSDEMAKFLIFVSLSTAPENTYISLKLKSIR